MRKCRESDIEFDFSNALQVFEHDTTASKCEGGSIAEGNTVWPGVVFRMVDSAGEIWIEVKNWQRMPGKFAFRMKNKAFVQEMREKFLGTTAFFSLEWELQQGVVALRSFVRTARKSRSRIERSISGFD